MVTVQNSIVTLNLNQFRIGDSPVGDMSPERKLERAGQTVGMLLDKMDNIGMVCGYAQNSKIESLASVLVKFSKIGKNSASLLVEVLQDNYKWMTINDAQKIAKIILSLGTLYKKDINSLDLPAGWTCPKANLCKSKADKLTGQIKDYGQFRCYACNHESQYDNVRVLRWHNFDVLNSLDLDGKIIAIETNMGKIVRLSTSGDIFNLEYWQALKAVAKNNPDKIIFGYTKILEYATDPDKPDNLYLIYSMGGMDDCQAVESNVGKSIVHLEDYSESVCTDHENDYSQAEDFFKILLGYDVHLNLHGTQPKKD